MTKNELIGQVAVAFLRQCLDDDGEQEGVARYLLDCLSAEETAAVAKAILADPLLDSKIDIKLSEQFVHHLGLPASVLTTERTTYFRNAACAKSALLVASTGDDERLSLKELTPIGSAQLLADPYLWINVVNSELGLIEPQLRWWHQCLAGLLQVRSFSLARYAEFVLEIARMMQDEGEPLLEAIGLSLPALRIPQDKQYFSGIGPKNGGHVAKWRSLFQQAISRRACYMLKQTPTQSLLTADDLGESFEKVKDCIESESIPVVEAFIRANSGWSEEAAALCRCDWDGISPLFEGLRTEKFNIGAKTLEFFDDRYSDVLAADDREYLNLLAKRPKVSNPDDDDCDFFESYRQHLKDDASLKAKWDKFIFGAPIECDDLLVGLTTCLCGFFDQIARVQGECELQIRSSRRTPYELRQLNIDAGQYFATKYGDLEKVLPSSIKWDVGDLFSYKDILAEWRNKAKGSKGKTKLNRSKARAALQIKFFIEFRFQVGGALGPLTSKQLVWTFNPEGVPSEMRADCVRLAKHPFTAALASREAISGKGILQPLDLRNSSSLHASFSQDRGSLVPAYRKELDLRILWLANLNHVTETELLSPGVTDDLRRRWVAFEECYSKCIAEFSDSGFSLEMAAQARLFGELLAAVNGASNGDRVRDLLLRPLLKIGVAEVDGDEATSILPPWHPLRLLSRFYKVEQVKELVSELLSGHGACFSDSRLYFSDFTSALSGVYYPDLAVDWRDGSPEILACSDHYLDYTVHERPVIQNKGTDDTNENPGPAAQLVMDLVKRYLALYPHERSNLSTVLYNCDSARLPQAVVAKMSELHVGDDELCCEVILRHRDPQRLSDLYEKIVESSGDGDDSFGGSEAANGFMSRLRIGIMADQAPAPSEEDGRPTDIVFLDDVIARHANVEWYLVKRHVAEGRSLRPPELSRKRPSALDDMKSVAYLTTPRQTEENWQYLDAIASLFCSARESVEGKCFVPSRTLDFGNNQTRDIFSEAHRLGNWVANYDELLDRRQLHNQGVRVIRYKQRNSVGRNLVVSSLAPLGLLASMVKSRIVGLKTSLNDELVVELTERFIDEANEVSGDLALRAAKRGRSASELMGVVLSKYLVDREIGAPSVSGWFFLDDYAEWLGQREGRIADLMALHLEKIDGQYRVGIIITEAKYIDFANLGPKVKESKKQLRETVLRIQEALFGKPAYYDRELWLTRLANLIVNGIHVPASASEGVDAWAAALLRQDCEIYVRGYSHVFVSGPSDSPDCSDRTIIADLEDCYQEVFSRSSVRELVEAFYSESDPLKVRTDVADSAELPERRYSTLEKTGRVAPPSTKPKDSTTVAGDAGSAVEKQPAVVPPERPPKAVKAFPVVSNGITLTDRLAVLVDKLPVVGPNAATDEWLNATAFACKNALQQFNLKAKLLEQQLTPNCALLKFQGSSNLTVAQVEHNRSQFLTSHGINIVAVRPEPGRVCISIARENREVVPLLTAWSRWNLDAASKASEVLLGINEDKGDLVCLSPRNHAPHSLIAGATGSGKSVLLQNMILSIAISNRPTEAQIILIDPKRVSFNGFKDLPHLRGGITKDQEAAADVLNGLVDEMNTRYALFEKYGVQDIHELRTKVDIELPILWVIHDEFALWMIDPDYSKLVELVVKKLAVAARAAGIFLIFAAQRPDKDVFPMQLRANLGNRLVLRVDSAGTSDLSLGEKGLGAEKLLGNGHMLVRMEGEVAPLFVQVPFADSQAIQKVVSLLEAEYTVTGFPSGTDHRFA
jgi:DNA segregation ATPase FtsK/SpoIIIE, S-DNA-T family